MKGKGRSRQAILAAVTVLAAAPSSTKLLPARMLMLQPDRHRSPEYRPAPGFRKDRTGNIRERTERSRLDGLRPRMAGIIWIRRPDG